jgi:LysM repeat protein
MSKRVIFILLMLLAVIYLLAIGVSPVLAAETATPTARPGVATATLRPAEDVVVSTPNPDGSIYHVVGYGQALWSIAIAYNTTIDKIRTLNNLSASATLRVGQKLLIRQADPPTLTPTITRTVPLPSRTPTATQPSRTPTLTRTSTPSPSASVTITVTPTPTTKPLLPFLPAGGLAGQNLVGVILIVVCAIGLVVVGLTGFRSKR